ALGGGAVTFLAPLLFPGLAEYPLALCAAAALLPAPGPAARPARARALDLLLPLGVGAAYLAPGALGAPRALGLFAGGTLAWVAFALGRRPARLAGALLVLCACGWLRPPVEPEQVRFARVTLAQERSWHGVLRLCRAEGAHGPVTALMHG